MTEPSLDGLAPDDLDGHTIEELSDYLDRGRQPRVASIENSPGCGIALDALARLRKESWAMLEDEALPDSAHNRKWIASVLANISRESHAGRDIPVSYPEPGVRLKLTEGSVRGLIRAAGDAVDGAIIGKVTLEGDVTEPGAPVTITINTSVAYGLNLTSVARLIRDSVLADVITHTELVVAAVNVTVDDIHTTREKPEAHR